MAEQKDAKPDERFKLHDEALFFSPGEWDLIINAETSPLTITLRLYTYISSLGVNSWPEVFSL